MTIFPPPGHNHPGIAESEARLDLLTSVVAEVLAEAKNARARQDRVIARLQELHTEFLENQRSDVRVGRHAALEDMRSQESRDPE